MVTFVYLMLCLASMHTDLPMGVHMLGSSVHVNTLYPTCIYM